MTEYIRREDALNALKIARGYCPCAYDEIKHLPAADVVERVTIEFNARKCPKCGKMKLFPRVDWRYWYCYSCKTQFPRKEAEAALKEESKND